MRGNLSMVNLLLDRQRLIPIWKLNAPAGSSGSIDATDHQVKPFLIETVDHKKCVQKSTALHLAATYGHLDIFKVLRENGASILCLDDKNQNVLHRACQVQHNTWTDQIA